MCETFKPNGEPLENNYRNWANTIFKKDLKQKPWFGIEQEYFLLDKNTKKPIGFEEAVEQGQYYCSVGINNAFGRKIAEVNMLACLNAGIIIS